MANPFGVPTGLYWWKDRTDTWQAATRSEETKKALDYMKEIKKIADYTDVYPEEGAPIRATRVLDRKPSIDCLPNEVLITIFENLDLKTQLTAQQVCPRWLSVIEANHHFKRNIIIKDMDPIWKRFKPYGMAVDRKTTIVTMDVFGRQHTVFQNNHLSRIISNFSNLQKLNLCLANCPTGGILELVANSLQNAHLIHTSLMCSDTDLLVTRKEVSQFCHSFPNIRVFQINAIDLMIKEESIAEMLRSWPNIEVFCLMSLLSNSEREGNVTDYTGYGFTYINPNIKYLKICGRVFTEEAIESFADKNPKHLEVLSISGLKELELMTIIGNKFTSITCLQLLSCSIFGDTSNSTQVLNFFKSISKLANLEKLRLLIEEIDIDYLGIKQLKKCRKLRALRIECSPVMVGALEAMASFLNLKKLDLTLVEFNPEVGDYIQWISAMKSLKKVILSYLKDESFGQLITDCPQLSHIDVSCHNELTAASVKAAIGVMRERPNQSLNCVFDDQLKNVMSNEMTLRYPNIKFRSEESGLISS